MLNDLVSIILTTKNSSKTLPALLESLQNQSYKNIEIVLVDNNSSDKTIEIAQKFTKNVFDFGPERSAQRNYAAKKAQGKYLFVIDSDMELTKHVVSECVEQFKLQKNLGGVIIPEKSFGEGLWSQAKVFERQINEGEVYFEAARFFPKKIFWEFGGYDENLTGPEDWDLPKRISKKYQMTRIRSYILHNEGHHTLWGLMKKKYYYGLSVHKYLKKQNASVISAQTIYFLRPAFYKKWRTLLSKPFLTIGMIVMLAGEMFAGGTGYLIGKLKDE